MFHAYTHVERIGKYEVKNILNGHVYVYPKMDGQNASIWSDNDGNIHCASRTREISIENDSADFAKYILTSESEEVKSIRNFCRDHKNYIVYGEYLGNPDRKNSKFLGTMKNYTEKGFYIFDIYDIYVDDFANFNYLSDYISKNYHYNKLVPCIGEFDNPSMDEISSCLRKNHYMLNDSSIGEGIVIKQYPSYRDENNEIQCAKLISDEYYDLKAKKIRNKKAINPDDIINEFVETLCTKSFVLKERTKIINIIGEDATTNAIIGRTINACIDALMKEEFWDFFRKRQCVVDLHKITNKIREQVLMYIL